MTPRLESSKKWTSFPQEFLSQISEVFEKTFATDLEGSELRLEGRIYPEEILLRVGFLPKGRLSQANFEVSIGYSQEKEDALERIHNCIDATASMMKEFFEADGEVDFPRQWKEFEFEKQSLYLQFSTVNTDLEAQADAILGEDAEGLLHEEEEQNVSQTEEDGPQDDDDSAGSSGAPPLH